MKSTRTKLPGELRAVNFSWRTPTENYLEFKIKRGKKISQL